MIAALSTGQIIGLLTVAGIFIVFALVSAFVIPRRNPNFPGEHVGLFSIVSSLFFVAMIAAILIFGVEPAEEEHAGGATTAHTETQPQGEAPTTGDATNGEALFTSKGCQGCHSIDGTPGAGPSVKGLHEKEETLADGTTVTADQAYLLTAILDPGKDVVKCPNCGPPSPMASVTPPGSITESDAEDLVAYIQTLK